MQGECEFCNYLQYRGSHMNILSSFSFTEIVAGTNVRYTYGADAGDYSGKGGLIQCNRPITLNYCPECGSKLGMWMKAVSVDDV